MAFALKGSKVAYKWRSLIYFFLDITWQDCQLPISNFLKDLWHISNLFFIMLPLREAVIFAGDLGKMLNVW